jgi:hypothetical protein
MLLFFVPQVQREIIFCLPDIIADEQHHEAALQLR